MEGRAESERKHREYRVSKGESAREYNRKVRAIRSAILWFIS
jgi:hypothetical protein